MTLVCFKCKCQFDEPSQLRRHVNISHPGEGAYHCPYCSCKFCLWSDWLEHKKNCLPKTKFSCVDCGETGFTKPEDVLRHDFKLHNKGAPVACLFCDKVFVLKRSLLWHLHVIHKFMAPHVCFQCGCSFQTARMLSDHNRSKHVARLPSSPTHDVEMSDESPNQDIYMQPL